MLSYTPSSERFSIDVAQDLSFARQTGMDMNQSPAQLIPQPPAATVPLATRDRTRERIRERIFAMFRANNTTKKLAQGLLNTAREDGWFEALSERTLWHMRSGRCTNFNEVKKALTEEIWAAMRPEQLPLPSDPASANGEPSDLLKLYEWRAKQGEWLKSDK